MSNRSSLIQAFFYNNPDQYPPIVNSSRLMADNGYPIQILCREDGQHWSVSYPDRVHVERIDTRSASSWRAYMGFVATALRRANKKAALFIGHDMHGFMPARLLATLLRRPLLYHCHDFADRHHTLTAGSRIVRAFEQNFARTADLVIVPDKDRGAVVSSALHLSIPPLIVANAPIRSRPVSGQASCQASGQALINSLRERGVQFDRILLRQGRIGPGHAIESTLRSIPHWVNRNWGFVLLGWGDSPYLKYLAELACTLNVTSQFMILPPVGYDQLAGFTSGAHAGHALYEPIHINNLHIMTASNKTMEYMAAGLPILISNRAAEREFVATYRCGLAADESSPPQVAGAVNVLLGDPAAAQKMGEAGRAAFEKEFSYERQYAPVLGSIRGLINPAVEGIV